MRLSGKTIGFMSANPLEDKRVLSGTMYSMAKAIESTGAKVVRVPVDSSSFLSKIYLKAVKEAERFLPFLRGRLSKFPMWKCRIVARKLDRRIIEGCDVLFAPMLSGALFLLDTDKPIIYLSDATFRLMNGYYWNDISPKDIKDRDLIEKTAMDKAAALVYPSHWVARSAVRDYGQIEEKITIARLGPNIDISKIEPHQFAFHGKLNILFVGVDWTRKGGQIAVDACEWLNANGIESTLHIVGIRSLDRSIASLPFVNNHGFLDKNNPEDYDLLGRLYRESDCFLLPTMAECAGIVFCEAGAYGLPCFSHDTGGVSDYVFEGETGRLLPVGATGADFGRVIKECVENGDMERFSKCAPEVVGERLSWDLWAEKFAGVVENLK